MNSNVIPFVPKSEKATIEKLMQFVDYCKGLLPSLGGDVDFNSDVWDITEWVKKKGDSHRVNIYFSNWENRNSTADDFVSMKEPFLSFVKSYSIYKFFMGATVKSNAMLAAFRVLELSLQKVTGSSQPNDISPIVLDNAANMLKSNYSSGYAYACGRILYLINSLASDYRLIKAPGFWINPLLPDKGYLNRVGKEYESRRKKKIPSPAAFNALGEIFQTGKAPDDVLVSSTCALLCSAPSRIVEITLLPSLCEVHDVDPKTGDTVYGIRFFPAKGGSPMVKYVARPMYKVVREALKKIRSLSEPALQIARWYEKNPTKLFLPPELEHLRDKSDLSMSEIDEIIFVGISSNANRGNKWAKFNSVPRFKKDSDSKFYADFSDVEKVVIKMLPKNFPFLDSQNKLKYSEALMLVRKNELGSRKSTYRCLIHQVIGQDIRNRICRESDINIFRKYNFTEDDGSEILVTTHKFRHYLNTIAQMNFMDQLDIARWSGRNKVSQNGYYDHVSSREITEKIRSAFLGEAAAIGPITNLHKVALVRRNEFALQKIPTAHTTAYGYCVHDYSMLPCQLHQDCMNCDEQVCIKGEGDCKEENIRALRSETELLLTNAKESLGNDVYGADKWVRHQQLTLDRLNSLCSILDDPNVPDQAVIRLDDSLTQGVIEQAMERRAIDLMHDEDHE